MFDSIRKTRRAGLVLSLALFLLIALTATVWAAWGAPLRSGWLTALAGATATPTRTPRPVTPPPTLIPMATAAPTSTAAPTQRPSPSPSPALGVTPQPLPPFLAEVAAHYGMDPSRRFVVVDQDNQRMYIWDPGRPLREMKVSTGDEAIGYPTPPWYGLIGRYWGTFFGFGVWADEGWYLFDDPTGSNLIHGLPYTLVDGRKVYQGLDALGNYPASHGCIRLHPDDAAWLTAWRPQGVPIAILPKTNAARPKG
jgi:lipoprotein-anchoring transpeptidase ErfK/SrfK